MSRSKNFSPQEKDSLMDCIAPYKRILECQETSIKSNTAKEEAWVLITDAFNAQNEYKRETKSLRYLYGVLKRGTKKANAEMKVTILNKKLDSVPT